MNGAPLIALAMAVFGLLLTAAGLLIIAVEAWRDRRPTAHRFRRDAEAMWREVYRALDEADASPRPARPFKRRRMAGARIPRRPIRRPTSTSNSERH